MSRGTTSVRTTHYPGYPPPTTTVPVPCIAELSTRVQFHQAPFGFNMSAKGDVRVINGVITGVNNGVFPCFINVYGNLISEVHQISQNCQN